MFCTHAHVQGLKAEQKTEEVKDLNVQKKQMQSQMNLVTAMSRGRLTHVTHSSVASDSEPERPKLPPKPTLPPAKVKDSKVRNWLGIFCCGCAIDLVTICT